MKTRDGSSIDIFCADGGGKWPIMGRVQDRVAHWIAERWTIEGSALGPPLYDIHPDSLPEFHAAVAGGDLQSLVPVSPRGASTIGSQHVAGSVSKKEPVSHSRSGASEARGPGVSSQDSACACLGGPRSFGGGAQ